MPSNSLKEFYHSATNAYAAALESSAAAQAYLTKRGLSRVSAQSFRLGVVESPYPGHEAYAGRLVVPYLTLGGVCGASFRCIMHEDCKPIHNDKYQWPSGFGRRMFNTPALDIDSPFIAICEGEIDTITASQAGIPAVGVPGAENWKQFWSRCFQGYDTVLILADGDSAKKRPNCRICPNECEGHRAGLDLARKIEADIPSARTVLMPEGHDVNSFVLQEGPDALRKKLGL